jgi:uncharacterized membrane protein
MLKRVEEKLDLIHEQTQKTNGRLEKAEDSIGDLKEEHTKAKAYAVAVSMLIGAVVTVANFVTRII